MKIRLVLSALVFAGHLAFGGRFDLPKESPQFSIQMPDKWETVVEGDNVRAHPGKSSKVMILVFPVPGAKNFEEAFSIATKQATANYRDVKIGKLSEQKQAGLTFFGGQGEGEKEGFELRLAVAAFSADGEHYFGLVWSVDEVSANLHLKDIDKVLASLQAFKEPPPKTAK